MRLQPFPSCKKCQPMCLGRVGYRLDLVKVEPQAELATGLAQTALGEVDCDAIG